MSNILIVLLGGCLALHFFMMRGKHGKHEEHSGDEPESKDAKKDHSGHGVVIKKLLWKTHTASGRLSL